MKTKITTLLGAGLSLLVTFGITHQAAAAAANPGKDFVADELLVAFQPGARGAPAEAVRNGLGATKIKAWPQIQAEHWRLPPGLGVARAVQALSANPNVLYAEPNYIAHAVADVPNDPLLRSLWGMHNIGLTGGTLDADIDALEAWQLLPGEWPVVVGVVDTGVDYTHEDLADRMWVNPGETGLDRKGKDKATNGKDDDHNGYVDDVIGWDFVNNDNDPMDDASHGTHVSGTIAANGADGIGVIGVAGLNPQVKIMPLKFLDASGSGTYADAISAVLYAASFLDASGNHVVRITSHSWSGSYGSSTLEGAILSSGALVVAAAGNDGGDTPHYPAGFSAPNIISVAATDDDDLLASFSNFGTDWVDLAAPGVSVVSSTPGNTYASKSGTSMATPHVSGVAALLMSQAPSMTIDEVKAQILDTVDLVVDLEDKAATGGRLNAARALGASELPADSTPPAAIADLAASPSSPNSVTLTWTAPGDVGYGAYAYDIRYSRNPIDTDADFAAALQTQSEPTPQAAGVAETFVVEDLSGNTTWHFVIKTLDLLGNVSPLSNPAEATTPLADWRYLLMGWGQNMGNYASLGRTSEGSWSVAYDDSEAGLLKCAVYLAGEGGYRIETVGTGGMGAALVYNASGQPMVSHVDGAKLLFATRIDVGSWTSTEIEGDDVNAGDTSVACDDTGEPVISYFKAGRRTGKNPAYGLWLARRSGSAWSTQPVDSDANAVYNQLAAGPVGELTIAYSGGKNGDTLKVARYNGAAWNISALEAGGSYATVAYDLVTGYPAVAHVDPGTGQLRFLRWNGTAWTTPETVETGPSMTGCALAFGPDGWAYLVYSSTELRLARRDPGSGVWAVQVVDADSPGGLRNSLKGRPLMTPTCVAYRGGSRLTGYPTTVLLAIRQTPY